MIALFFIGRSSNPTSEYNFYENIFLNFLFLTNLFNVLAVTTHSLLRSHNVKTILWPWIKPMIRVTDCTPCTDDNIDLVVITTSSVYCDHKEKKQQANRQTKHQTSKPKKQMKKKKRKQTKNK